MKHQNKSVSEFFNSISSKYDEKYKSDENNFLAHFFGRRIKMATEDLPAHLGTVMDVGAGTGQLYTFLKENGYSFDEYIAVDVSGGMLSHSSIPKESRYTGTVHLSELDSYESKVNHFFILGVTTYMSAVELDEALVRIQQLSAEKSRLICTFTNRKSIEFIMQATISSILCTFQKILGNRLSMVAAQAFPRLIINEKRMKAFLAPYGSIERIDYLNQTLTPFNRIFTRISIKFESYLTKKLKKWPEVLAVLSSDVLFKVLLHKHRTTDEDRVSTESEPGKT